MRCLPRCDEEAGFRYERDRRPPHRRRARGTREDRPEAGSARDARRVDGAAGSARSRRAARGAGCEPRAGARSDPLRADAHVAVRVLPWRRVSDGIRSRPTAAHRPHGAALRRRPSLELRGLRLGRAQADLQRQRLRRDAARAVRVGREAPRCELCRRSAERSASTRRRADACYSRSDCAIARRSAGSAACAISTSGTPGSTSRRRSPASGTGARQRTSGRSRRRSPRRTRRTAQRPSAS